VHTANNPAYGVQLITGAPSHVWQYSDAPGGLDADIPTGDLTGLDDIAGSLFTEGT
jgi:hypothetical protein